MALWVVFSAAAAQGAGFRLLEKLRPTDQFSDAYAVSADGSTVVGISHTGTWSEAVRWTFPVGVQSMGAGQPSTARGVSADGSVIVGALVTPTGGEAYRWTQATGLVGLRDLPGGVFGSDARDVSTDGSIVVGSSATERGGEAFRWAPTGLVGLGLSPDGFRTVATGVSADGSVIVGNGRTVPEPTFGDQAFRWTAATGIVGLGDLPGGGFYSEAADVSADGTVVVGRSTTDKPDFSAFRWTEATGMVELPPVRDGIPFVRAEGISGNGKVIVGSGAIVWDEFHGSRVLRELLVDQGVDLGDWNPVGASSASYDGETIVGFARSPTLGSQAFVARLNPGTFVPEPSSLVSSAIGLLIAVTFAWRTRRRRAPLR